VGCVVNYYNTRLVDKLVLTVLPHPKSYKLHWLNEDEDLIVNHLVKVKLSKGKYEDSLLCEVVLWKLVVCCNCRAISNITIKYKHLIPRLNDMLDELHGSTIFSKMDV